MTCSYRPIKRVDNGHEVAKDKKELIVHPIISKKVALLACIHVIEEVYITAPGINDYT